MQLVELKSKPLQKKVGFTFNPETDLNSDGSLYESTAIGGISSGFCHLKWPCLCQTFGNGGIYNEPITIEKIVQSDEQ